ncbi:MAG: SpoIVB peptidase S55 domain-containing protein [Sedimentisphaerales bacterium]
MSKSRAFINPKMGFFLFCLLVCAGSFSWAGEQLDKTGASNVTEGVWDPAKYIDINEIQPGMEAYCLTVYKGTEVEKFEMEVLSVVRNVRPGRDAILVQGTDERFIHTGPVGGCSGSPVYIDGRLAGALAFGWHYSKDPLYGVTPIKEMLEAGQVSDSKAGKGSAGAGRFVFDFSTGLDFAKVYEQITTSRVSERNIQGGLTFLPCPLITSGLPAEVCEQMGDLIEPFGLMVVSGIGGSADTKKTEDVKLEPGGCLVVPLITGDIEMEIIGTVTEVEGDKVYGFGHSLIGHGLVDLPMATGKVHTVVSSVRRSFKFASAIEIVGALTVDEAAAVSGHIGAEARMFPLTITVDHYNDAKKRVYNCQVADNRLLTPRVLLLAVTGATLYLGVLPPDHMIEYQVTIGVEGAEPVTFENVSTSVGLKEMLTESITSVGILLNNPYKDVDIESINFDIRLRPKDISSRIWSVDLSDSRLKAGQQLDVTVVVETFLAEKKKYQFSLKIPDELAPGVYDLIVCGGYDYRDFLRKAAPYKFVPQNLATLIEVMNNILTVSRDKLYCLLVLPPGGVALEQAELPDLPATRVLVLQDAKRALRIQPYLRWLENSLTTGTVIVDKKVMYVTVQE